MSRKVHIAVSQERGYVWDVRDVELLRTKYHICGHLTGTLPQVGQQNVFLGLPLQLLPEEVTLLVKNEIGCVVDDRAAHVVPSSEQSESYHRFREEAIAAQRADTIRVNEENRSNNSEKYRKQKKKDVQDESTKSGVASFQVVVPDSELPPPTSTTSTTSTTTVTTNDKAKSPIDIPYTVVIVASSTDIPWYDPSTPHSTYTTLTSAKEAKVWSYPTTPLQQAKCNVFEDLWKKGYFLGGGLRFGGDFLVYPGDPLRYHSHFALTVLPSPQSPILPLDLVAYGRLATAVKKAHLLASWDPTKDEATYLSLEWAAFG